MISDAQVLVVDDNEVNRTILFNHLKKQGVPSILEAQNGRLAVEMLHNHRIDLVLLDVMMPEMDGYEVLERMKSDTELRHIPVIMITALDDLDSAVKCIELGAEDYLPKPFNAVLLGARVTASLEKKRLRDIEREYLRHYDPITGLPNRDFFLKRLSEELQRWRRNPSLFTVLVIKLMRYRILIDSLGRTAGDVFMARQGQRLTGLLPSDALMARVAQNEFALVLQDLTHAAEGIALAGQIHQALEQTVSIQTHDISGGINIGVALSSSGYNSPEDILRDAGLAANRVDQRSGYKIFDDAMHREAMKRLELEPELQAALSGGQLCLYYQPIVALESGEVSGFEALIRWLHPEKGMVPPGEFITLAEETGLIVPIGVWILEEVCRQAARWLELIGPERQIVIGANVSAHQFADGNLIETVRGALRKAGLPGANLKIEMTESALIDNADQVWRILSTIQKMDVLTALDDFGTGYCSLSYLHQFPFDSLKIDQTFVNRIQSKPKNMAIVQSTVLLAHELGLDVIAEGIETPEEGRVLRSMQCEYGQGNFYQPPLTSADAEDLLVQNRFFPPR